MTSLNAANELMLSHVLRYLPTPLHNAYACSSGTKGYCALKETLQNGIPGHTLLIESKDLRDLSEVGEQCCLVYISSRGGQTHGEHKEHIPPTVTHVTVYGNVTSTPPRFLAECTGLTSVDLSPLSQLTEVSVYFLWGCTGLKSVDLSPLSQVTVLKGYFLSRCISLTSVDLSPLSQVTEVHGGFFWRCTGLTSVDLGPLAQITVVHEGFLWGCTGLTSVDLSPLSQVTMVREGFLAECTGLTTVDLSAMEELRVVLDGFLEACYQITDVDNIPPLCARPPSEWFLKDGKWVRV